MNISRPVEARTKNVRSRHMSRFKARALASEKRADRLRVREEDPAWYYNVFSPGTYAAIGDVAAISERQRTSYITRMVGVVVPSAIGGAYLATQSASLVKETALLLGTNDCTSLGLASVAGYLALGSAAFVASGALGYYIEMQETTRVQKLLSDAFNAAPKPLKPTVSSEIGAAVRELVQVADKYAYRKPSHPKQSIWCGLINALKPEASSCVPHAFH